MLIRAVLCGTSGMGARDGEYANQWGGGARVLVTGVSKAGLDSAQKEIGKHAFVVESDARSLTGIDTLASRVKSEFGTFDLRCVSAGFSLPTPLDGAGLQFTTRESANARLPG